MDRIKDSFARQGLMQTLGAELSAIAEGRVVITAPITPAASQQHGFAHAGMTFALGDSAAGYSALTLMPEGADGTRKPVAILQGTMVPVIPKSG